MGRALGEPGLKPTVRVGEAAIREVAAYLLDHDHFAQVPHTVLVKFTHPIFHIQTSKESSPRPSDTASVNNVETQSAASLDSALSSSTQQLILAGRASLEGSRISSKLGSLQEFVAHDCDTSEIGPSLFSLQDVHRIAILDIRLFNTDRHAGNILVQRPTGQGRAKLSALARLNQPQCRLLPIDHGFCLPEALEPPFFEWLHWPQVCHQGIPNCGLVSIFACPYHVWLTGFTTAVCPNAPASMYPSNFNHSSSISKAEYAKHDALVLLI